MNSRTSLTNLRPRCNPPCPCSSSNTMMRAQNRMSTIAHSTKPKPGLCCCLKHAHNHLHLRNAWEKFRRHEKSFIIRFHFINNLTVKYNMHHGVSLTTVWGVPMVLLCPVSLETNWHVSFIENFHSHPAPGNQRFEITMGGQKIKFVTPSTLGSTRWPWWEDSESGLRIEIG